MGVIPDKCTSTANATMLWAAFNSSISLIERMSSFAVCLFGEECTSRGTAQNIFALSSDTKMIWSDTQAIVAQMI
jgi:hypothetical protein